MSFGPPILGRDGPDFAARFAPEAGSRAAFRTAPGTVPGTVPPVVPGRSVQTRSTAPNVALHRQLCSSGLAWSRKPPLQDGSTGLCTQEAADSDLPCRPPRLLILSQPSPTASGRPCGQSGLELAPAPPAEVHPNPAAPGSRQSNAQPGRKRTRKSRLPAAARAVCGKEAVWPIRSG